MIGESFPINAYIHTIGHLPIGVKINILVDIGASKCFMSIAFHLNQSYLYKLPRYTAKATSIQVSNSKHCTIL